MAYLPLVCIFNEMFFVFELFFSCFVVYMNVVPLATCSLLFVVDLSVIIHTFHFKAWSSIAHCLSRPFVVLLGWATFMLPSGQSLNPGFSPYKTKQKNKTRTKNIGRFAGRSCVSTPSCKKYSSCLKKSLEFCFVLLHSL